MMKTKSKVMCRMSLFTDDQATCQRQNIILSRYDLKGETGVGVRGRVVRGVSLSRMPITYTYISLYTKTRLVFYV